MTERLRPYVILFYPKKKAETSPFTVTYRHKKKKTSSTKAEDFQEIYEKEKFWDDYSIANLP
ncbi:hypothetical protein STRDD12_00694 [Streptococcus sp. DD12]|nr:hypothetical protein STRDD12_00694 [Streptococcus sp. DD12]